MRLPSPTPPRFFAALAPAWALYLFAVLLLGAMTAVATWMVQQRWRLPNAILLALGVGAGAGALGVVWQRTAWRGRVRRWGTAPATACAAPLVARTERRAARSVRGLTIAGAALALLGLLGAWRDHRVARP